MKSAVKNTNKSMGLQILKGSITSVSITLVLILLFALLIRFVNINEGVIMPVNQFIKIVSIFLGVYSALKFHKEKGWVKGMLIGAIYSVLSFVVFSILSSQLSFSMSTLLDILFSGIIGGLSGVIAVNMKN